MRLLARKAGLVSCNAALTCLGAVKARGYNTADTIVVSSFPRSGSTWLAEILNTVPKTCILWEPLNPGDHWTTPGLKKNPELHELGLDEYPVIGPGSPADRPEVHAYIERVLTGRVLSRYTLSHAIAHVGWRRIVASERWIVNFCRANGMLRWMTQRFPVRPVVLIRHPCAVVASRAANPDWSGLDADTLATMWCRNHQALVSAAESRRCLITTYEGLVAHGDTELKRIFDWLGMDMASDAHRRMAIPSASTTKASFVAQGRNPLLGWSQVLSESEIQRVLGIAWSYGLDFYTRELEPDYGRLEALRGTGSCPSACDDGPVQRQRLQASTGSRLEAR